MFSKIDLISMVTTNISWIYGDCQLFHFDIFPLSLPIYCVSINIVFGMVYTQWKSNFVLFLMKQKLISVKKYWMFKWFFIKTQSFNSIVMIGTHKVNIISFIKSSDHVKSGNWFWNNNFSTRAQIKRANNQDVIKMMKCLFLPHNFH